MVNNYLSNDLKDFVKRLNLFISDLEKAKMSEINDLSLSFEELQKEFSEVNI